MSRDLRFLKNTILVASQWGTQLLAALVVSIIVARTLGPDGKGMVNLVMSSGMLLGYIFILGFDRSTVYYLASGKLNPRVVLGSWIVTLSIGTFLALGLLYPLFLTYLMDSVFRGITPVLLLLGLLLCPLYILRCIINSMSIGKENFVIQTKHNLSIYIASLAASVIGLLVFGFAANGYVAISFCFGLCSVAYGIIVARKIVVQRLTICFDAWRKMFSYGSKSMMAQILNQIDLRLDIYIINYMIGTSSVGIYSIAVSLVNVLGILSSSVSIVLLPLVSKGDPDFSSKATRFICRISVFLVLITGLPLLLIGQSLITLLFGVEFAGAGVALILLYPGVVGQTISKICYADCAGRGYPEKVAISSFITAGITITLDILLIPELGIKGAAIASSIAYLTGGCLGAYWYIKITGDSLKDLLIVRGSDFLYCRKILSEIFTKKIR